MCVYFCVVYDIKYVLSKSGGKGPKKVVPLGLAYRKWACGSRREVGWSDSAQAGKKD